MAYSRAIKNAAAELGPLFGANLHRGDEAQNLRVSIEALTAKLEKQAANKKWASLV